MTRTATATLLLSLSLASTARAASRVVVVDDSDRATREATARLRAELTASGFTVDAGDDAGDASSVATIRLTRDAATRSTEVSVSDRLTGKTLVRRVSADPERAPRLVALRGVELLRASLLELTSPPKDDAPPATPALASPPPPEVVKLVGPPPAGESTPPPRARRWSDRVSIDAGAAVLASTEGLGAAFAPTLGAWLPLPAHLALRPRLTGPAFRSGVANAIGSATTHQELGSLELAWAPLDGPFVPFLALGGGAYHLHIDGTATAPGYHDASDDVVSAMASAGLGAFVRLAPGVAIALEARGIELTPHPVVAIGNTRVAAAGAPSLFASASLVAAF